MTHFSKQWSFPAAALCAAVLLSGMKIEPEIAEGLLNFDIGRVSSRPEYDCTMKDICEKFDLKDITARKRRSRSMDKRRMRLYIVSAMHQLDKAFGDEIGPETKKYLCAPCSNCKGQMRDLIKYYGAWAALL